MSLFAKAQGFRVVATDIAERSIIIGRALIENSRIRLIRQDILRLLEPHDWPSGSIEATMSPSVFTSTQARFLDSALRLAGEMPDPPKANMIRLLALRFALLCHPYAQVRKGTAHRMTTGEYECITESALYHYADALRLATPGKLWALAEQINAGVFEGRATVMKRSVLEALPEIQADVAYFDPPYPGVMSYEREYRVIDEIFEGTSRPTSPFTAKDGHNMIDPLFERAQRIPIWVLSLGNAVVSIEELEAKMVKFGRKTKAIALHYQHLPAVATVEKKATNQEFLVIGVDPAWQLQREVGRRDGHAEFITHTVVEQDMGSSGAQSAAPGSLACDAFEQREADLTQQLTSPVGAETFPIVDGGVDVPDAVLLEGALHRDSELRLGSHFPTESLVRDSQVKEENV